MATDLAEFLGGAIGLSLLFHLPLMAGLAVTGVMTYALLELQRIGYRPFEYIITAMVVTVGACFLLELAVAPPDWGQAAIHSVLPLLPDNQALLLAVGIIGATVMPHAIYLHSGLTQDRVLLQHQNERRRLIQFSNREVWLALGFAGIINMAMVIVAADAFHAGHADITDIATAYHMLGPLLGTGAAGLFLVALMASGISSSAVGTLAGQIVMQGFVGFRIPLWVRRAVTMLPTFAVVAAGYNTTSCLIISQVVLSLILPMPMVALIWLIGRRDVMGDLAVGRWWLATASVCCALVTLLNVVLLLQLAGVSIPFLPA